MRLIPIAGSIGAATVCDKDQIVFHKINGLLLTVLDINDLLCDLLTAFLFNDYVFDVHTVLNTHTVCFQVLAKRKNHALVLIVFCKAQCRKIGKSVNVMHVSAKIALHLQCTGPFLERKHGLPIQPEVCTPEGFRQNFFDLLVLQILLRCDKQAGQRQCRFFIQRKLFVCMRILSAIDGCTAQRIVGVMFIQPIVLVQYRNIRRFNGWYVTEYIPHYLKVVIHFTTAAHIKSLGHIFSAVAATAGNIQLFQKVNVLSLHLSVTYQIKGGSQSGKPGTDDIGRFFVHTQRLLGACK